MYKTLFLSLRRCTVFQPAAQIRSIGDQRFYSKRYKKISAFKPNDQLTHLLAQASAYVLMIVFMARISPLLCAVCVFFGLTGAVCPLALRKKGSQLNATEDRAIVRYGAFFPPI